MTKDLLIVDDDPVNLKLFSILAEKNQWSFDTAIEGQEVQTLIKSNDYRVMLLDIQLPGLDGLTLMKKMRAEGIGSCMIAVTAYAMTGDREKILEAGADFYLAKPVNIDELVEKVRQNLKDR